MRAIAYMAARGQIGRQGSRCEPVIVRGTGFNGDLIEAVAAELRFRGVWVSDAIAQHQIEARRLLLILDGISEMNPGHIAGLVTSLKGLGKQTYLATSVPNCCRLTERRSVRLRQPTSWM
jgi:hypothetical protein